MNLREIKKIHQADTNTLFVKSAYSTPTSRNSEIVQLLSTKRIRWRREYGWAGYNLEPKQLQEIENDISNSNYLEGEGRSYLLLAKIPAGVGVNDNPVDLYRLITASEIRGIWAIVENLWQREKQIYAKLEILTRKKQEILMAQQKAANIRARQITEQIQEFLLNAGIDDLTEISPQRIISDVGIRFERKTYPELEHLGKDFTDDLDNYKTEIQHSIARLPLDHLLVFMEMIYQLQQDKADLEKELERERKRTEIDGTSN